MDNKKKLLLNLLLAAMTVSTVAGVAACDEGDPVDYGEKGVYYFDADGEEYVISLNGSTFTLSMGDEAEFGTYTYDGSSFTMTYGESASLEDGVLTLAYGGNTYQFLKKVNYTVTFDVDGGSDIAAATVTNGKTLAKPADPTKQGYEFVGWFADEDYQTPFSFGATPVKNDMTLYALYAKESAKEYAVTLVVDGETLERKETIGAVAQTLPTPTKEGATFLGWWKSDYEDASRLTAQYTGGVLTEDTTLYAVWENDAPAISVSSTGAMWTALGATDSYTVRIKDADGNTLVGPVTSGATTYLYDFSSKVAGDYVVEVSNGNKTAYAYYQNKALDRVSNLYVSGSNTLIYGGVENAEKYIITIVCGNGDHVHTQIDNGNSTYYNFANCEMKEGGITFSVQAVAKGYATSVSDTLTFERKLDAVTGVQYDAATGMVSWNAVTNATNYVVTVEKDGATPKTYNAVGTNFSLKGFGGDVTVKVTAKASGYVSNFASVDLSLAKYAAPTNVRTEMVQGVPYLMWDAVEAEGVEYFIYVGANAYRTTETRIAWPAAATIDGTEYKVKMKAVDVNGGESFVTDEIKMNYKKMGEVTYKAGRLSWTPVVGATYYSVKVNGVLVSPEDFTGTSLDVTLTKEGTNDFSVTYYNEWYLAAGLATTEAFAYKIDLMTQGGTGAGAIYRAMGDPLALEDTTKTGYDFTGWYNVPGGANVNGALYSENYFYGGSDLTLYASWTSKQYDVQLKLDAVTDDVYATDKLYYGQTINLPVPESPVPGKIFGGWVNAQTNSPVTDAYGNSGNYTWPTDGGATFYASWIDILSFTFTATTETDGYFTVTRAAGVQYAKEITIPATYEKDGVAYPVKAIAAGAFEGCKSLLKVNIPDTVTDIPVGTGGPTAAGSVFKNCDALKEIHIYCADEGECTHATDRVYSSTEDGVLLRADTTGTELYYFPQGKTDSEYVIPDSVNILPTNVFRKAKVVKVVVPSSVHTVEKNVFRDSQIQEIVFNSATTTVAIESGAFANCGALETITLPNLFNAWDVKLIENSKNIKNIYIDGTNGFYSSLGGVLCNGESEEIIYYPVGRDGAYTIPDQISVIRTGAFSGCTRLTGVTVSEFVSEIQSNAFNNCTQLRSLTFLQDASNEYLNLTIASSAFYGCVALPEVTLPAHLSTLGANAFGRTRALTEVTLNAKADATLAFGAFRETQEDGYRTYVQSIIVGKDMNVEFTMTSLFVAANIYEIDVDKDNDLYASKDDVLFSKDMKTLLFYPYGKTENYEIPDTVETIANNAFQGRTGLTDLVIGANVTSIGNYAFASTTITSLTFADRTKDLTIGNYAFQTCKNLDGTVTLKQVTSLGTYAFSSCSNLDVVEIPASLTEFNNNAFTSCSQLTAVNVLTGNTALSSDAGVVYNANKTELVFVPAGFAGDENNAYEIPTTLTNIKAGAFKSNKAVEIITFADRTKEYTIAADAFQGMTALQSITLPTTVTAIQNNMFKGCSALTSFDFTGITSVGEGAFQNCSSLATANNFASVTTIGKNAFSGCSALATINGFTAVTTVGITAFQNCSALTSFNIPKSVTSLGKDAFKGCTNLATFTFEQDRVATGANGPTTLSLGEGLFYNCSNLTSVVFPEGVTLIQKNTFYGCAKLSAVTIPSTVTQIGESAFGATSNANTSAAGTAAGTTLTVKFSALDTSKNLTSKLTTIAAYAFKGTSLSGDFVIPNSVTNVGTKAFSATKITSVVVPSSVTSVNANMFENCTSLTSATVNTTKLSNYMFSGCTSLSTLNLADSVKEIGQYALSKVGLTTYTVPSTVTTIKRYAFQNCSKLREIVVAGANTNFEKNTNGSLVFDGCAALQKAVLYTTTFETTNAAMFNSCTELEELWLPNATTIPKCFTKANGTTSYTKTAPKLAKLVLSDNLTTIGQQAFYGAGATAATALTVQWVAHTTALTGNETLNDGFPASITKIDQQAFMTSGLGAVSVGNGTVNVNVGNNAFKDCTKLTTATLGAKVNSLGTSVFAGCSNLLSATVNASVTTIPNYTFQNCEKLGDGENGTLVLNGNYTSIGTQAFENCSSLTSFDVPASVMTINLKAFSGCTNLATLNFATEGAKLATIGNNAFESSGLTSFVLPMSEVATLTLGTYIFANCAALTEIKLTPNVQSVAMVFSGMKCTPAITLYEDVAYPNLKLDVANCTVLSADGKTLLHVYSGTGNVYDDDELQEGVYQIPAGVNIIASSAFYGATWLKAVIIPASVTTIQANAFQNCSNLANLTFLTKEGETGYGISEIGDYAFSQTALTTVYLPASVQTVGDSAFYNCASLKTVTVDGSVNGSSVFKYCTALTTATLNGNTLGESMFESCTSLSSVTINGKPTQLNGYTFKDCASLTTIDLPDTISEMGAVEFKNTGLTSIRLPANLVTMGEGVFYMCRELTTVIVNVNLTAIPKNAFLNCSKLSAVRVGTSNETVKFELPTTVTEIGDCAFQACGKIAEVNLPAKIQSIGNYAFFSCVSMTAINFGGEQSEGITIGEKAFYGCNNEAFTTVNFPANVTSIGDMAFAYCRYLTSVKMPSSLSALGESAFYACAKLQSADLSKMQLMEIPVNAFGECVNLTSVQFPAGLTKIDQVAFIATGLTALDLSSFTNLEVIGNLAFADCTALATISLPASVTELGNRDFLGKPNEAPTYCNSPFMGCLSLETIEVDPLNVAFNVVDDFLYTAEKVLVCIPAKYDGDGGALTVPSGVTLKPMQWKFKNGNAPFYGNPVYYRDTTYGALHGNQNIAFVTFSEGVEEIPIGFFMGSNVRAVEIPSSLTTIGKSAFYGLTALRSIALPEGLTTIDDNAFNGCTGLTYVQLPSTLTTIGARAFMNTGLQSVVIPASVTKIGSAKASGGDSMGSLDQEAKADATDPNAITANISEAFANCKSLQSVVFQGTNVATMSYGGTFKGCTALQSVTLGSSWTTLEANMFDGCTALMELTLPSTITTVGNNVFAGWTSAQTIYATSSVATKLSGKSGNATVQIL